MSLNEQGSAAGVTLASIALVIAVLALILGWVAFNRTGENLENMVQRQVDEAVQQVQDATPNNNEQQQTQPQQNDQPPQQQPNQQQDTDTDNNDQPTTNQ